MTHEGSGMGNCLPDLESKINNCNIVGGLAIRGSDCANAESTVINWIKKNI